MPNGYSRSPKLLKGALIEFSERFLGPIPNVIAFQYNPETMVRNLEVWQPPGANSQTSGVSSTAQPQDPPETFSLQLELDATDALEEPASHPVAVVSGVADRLAAMEMLLYPQEESLLGGLLGSVTGSLSVGGGSLGIGGGIGGAPVPRGTVPVVLFVWGPGRIIPVRLTSFSVEEQAYSPTLFPIRAKVSIGLKVLTKHDFCSTDKLSEKLAVFAYEYTRKQKQVLAAANIANTVESILGLLPF
ncbi:MAG: hypothetical protein R2824_25530 [Saprospiraceae bacterium]|nr:hypothetical protein [Lewinella sp.]